MKLKNIASVQSIRSVKTEKTYPYPLNQTRRWSLDDVCITFYAAVRKKDNNSFNICRFLDSVIQHAYSLPSIEILIAVDPDDDLDYFTHLKAKYDDQLHLRLYISNQRFGYEKLHLYDKFLFKQASPGTRMFCDFSDDCVITQKSFDRILLNIDKKYADNIYFIHTRLSKRHEYLGDISKNINYLFWIMQAVSPASYFPIVSKRVIDLAFDYAETHDAIGEWSPIANSWICDCYVDILSVLLKNIGLNRISEVEMIRMDSSVVSSFHYRDKRHHLTPNNYAFIKMLQLDTVDYLKGLSHMLLNNATDQHEIKEARAYVG